MSTPQPHETEGSANAPVLGYARTAPPSALAVLLCRLLAVWMFALGLYDGGAALGDIIATVINRNGSALPEVIGGVIAAVLPALTWILVASYCWKRAPKLANRMSRGLEVTSSSPVIGSDELMHVLLVCIGVYLLAEGLPVTAWLVYVMFESVRDPSVRVEYKATVFSGVIRVALGVWLILRTRGAMDLIYRYGGKWRDEPQDKPKEETLV